MKVLPALTVLEFALQVAQAGGPGKCVMAFAYIPKPRESELHFIELFDEAQYNNIMEQIKAGESRVFRVTPKRPV